MTATMWRRWFIVLSLFNLSAVVLSDPPAQAQFAVGSGSVGSRSGGSQETPGPIKPKGFKPDGNMRSVRPPDMPGQVPVPHERAQALEERLRNGQMKEPVAQGQISDRLEQLHRGSAESSAGDAATGQTPQ
ncbi:MAG TPA: hypothetical protein VKP13_18775 [Nitrospira sp.]|nr:hypothetical protein [Nitrospira sp.]